MLIKLSHLFGKVQIKTVLNDPDDPVTPIIQTEQSGLEDVLRHALSRSYGHYGHLIDLDRTTNLDLIAAARSLQEFKVVSVEPVIVANPLPKDAVS